MTDLLFRTSKIETGAGLIAGPFFRAQSRQSGASRPRGVSYHAVMGIASGARRKGPRSRQHAREGARTGNIAEQSAGENRY